MVFIAAARKRISGNIGSDRQLAITSHKIFPRKKMY